MASFTALNGGEAKTSEHSSGSPTEKRLGSEERPGGSTMSQEQRPSGEVSTSQREHWSGPGADRPTTYQPASYPDVEASHKRKRSNSVEPRREAPSAPEVRISQPSPPEPRDVYGTPQQDRDYRPYREETRERAESWYSQQHRDDRGVYDTQNSAGSIPSQSDEQIGDALRRATGPTEAHPSYSPTSPEGDDTAYYATNLTPEQRRDGAVIQSDPKKRKRTFANRTKTGCLTCRRRKKKCDETKPECNNCHRGGFLCHGYPNQRGYQKMENKPAAVPLESKDPTYVPPGAYGMPQQQPPPPPYASQPPPAGPPIKREGQPPYRGQTLRIDPPQGRPVLTDDDRQTASTIPTASVTSPDNKISSAMSAYSNAANVFPTPISAITPASNFSGQKDYQRIPPLHDTSRTEMAEPPIPHPGSALPQINILHRNSSPAAQSQPPQTTSAQVAAQLALSHSHFPPANRQPTQKELMLQGQMYRPFDKELVLERERCSAACWRFNNSTNPNNGVSATERSRLFREILMPKEPINISPSLASPVSNLGRVGADVVVEAPFTCDYGYNMQIGQNVFIGRNCTILDPVTIKIGNNVYIGPNASLFAATLQTDYLRRMGSKSSQIGKQITIEDDAWIGGGVIILPGVTIGRGSTVGAGSVVTRNVAPFTITSGNPARPMRALPATS